jgi:thymidylate kinase
LSSYYGFFDEAAIDGMFEEIRKENEAFAPCADMLIIFDMSVEEALKRISQNRVCVDSFETRENLMQVRASFSRVERLIRATGKTEVVTVDASGDEATVSARLQSIVLDGFGRRGVVL